MYLMIPGTMYYCLTDSTLLGSYFDKGAWPRDSQNCLSVKEWVESILGLNDFFAFLNIIKALFKHI